MRTLARIAPRRVAASRSVRPSVTCIVAAHDERDRLVRKVENLLAQEWAGDHLDVTWATTGGRLGRVSRGA